MVKSHVAGTSQSGGMQKQRSVDATVSARTVQTDRC